TALEAAITETVEWLEANQTALEAAITETVEWLETNQGAEVEEYEAKQKSLEQTAMPIMTKIYQVKS
ncbi:hypothetical protein T484DRAFT_1859154, partial [Baffinella frigidus]